MTLLHLFFIFFYIGLFAIGGGLVAATFMQQTLVEKYGLITQEKFYAMLAISESTPGPIGINLATYIGDEMFGPLGAIITTIGEVLPSIIVIMIIAKFFMKFQEKKSVQTVLSVMRPVTSGMVLVALVNVIFLSLVNISKFSFSLDGIKQIFNWPEMFFFVVSLVIMFRTKLHPVFLILLGGIFGVLFL